MAWASAITGVREIVTCRFGAVGGPTWTDAEGAMRSGVSAGALYDACLVEPSALSAESALAGSVPASVANATSTRVQRCSTRLLASSRCLISLPLPLLLSRLAISTGSRARTLSTDCKLASQSRHSPG